LDPIAIDAGNGSDLALMSDGTVWGWGLTEVAPQTMTLVQIPGLHNVMQDPVDGNHDFAALEQPGIDAACPGSSTVMTWGLNQDGDLGIGVRKLQSLASPQDVTTLDCQDVVQIAAASSHMIALTADGRIFVWGLHTYLGLGASSTKNALVPALNSAATALTGGTADGIQITAGSGSGGVLVNGQAYAWGANVVDQCGCGSSAALVETPTAVEQGALLFTFIDQGGNGSANGHTLALDASGDVYAWGDGAAGQLGNGGTNDSAIPELVGGLPAIVAVRAGGLHSLALDAEGNVWAWGANQVGQVGDGTRANALLPEEVLSGARMISPGSRHSIAA
jgi:alpha-tubulin suppressor-like RCC1 family protein